MSILNLDKIFKPQRIAVTAGSDNPESVGYSRIIISAGFKEIGEERKKLEERIKERNQRIPRAWHHRALVMPQRQFCRSYASRWSRGLHFPVRRRLHLGLGLGHAEGIGFPYFVSIGSMVDVNFGDLTDYFGQDERTRPIIRCVESATKARHLTSAARAFARTKPVVEKLM